MKKSSRGAENIMRFNENREKVAFAAIECELVKCKKHRMRFKSLGALAEYISSVTKIHRTTLMRNPRYRSLLANFSGVEELSRSKVPDGDAPLEVLRARMLALRLENANLVEKVRRLEARLKSIGEHKAVSVETEQLLAPASDKSMDYVAFADTAMVLTALLERLKDTMVLNFEKKVIEDYAARPSQRVVVGPERLSAYFQWLNHQKDLLIGFVDLRR